MPDSILISRVLEYTPLPFFVSGGNDPDPEANDSDCKYSFLVLDKIKQEISDENTEEVSNYTTECFRDYNYHVGRVKYFVNNPDMITPIEFCIDLVETDICIYNGYHRVMAAIILEWEKIESTFVRFGRPREIKKFENYLIGKRSDPPEL